MAGEMILHSDLNCFYGAALVDSFARNGIAEQEGITAAVQSIAGLVPRSE